MKRLQYIDAIKGIACLGVFIHHLIIYLLPATYTGLKEDSVISGDYLLGSTPLGFIINGNFWVCTFLIISSFLLANGIFTHNEDKRYIAKALIKRYPRLMLPVFAVNILCMILYFITSFFGFNINNPLEMSFFKMLKATVIDMWVTEDIVVMGYWMMHILFIGSFISIILSVIVKECKKYFFIILLLSIPFLVNFSTYYIATVLGVLLASVNYRGDIEKLSNNKIVKISLPVIAIIAIIFAGYPSSGLVFQNIYGLSNYLPDIIKNSPQLFHIIAAFLFIVIFMLSKGLKSVCDNKLFSFLGKISFSVYLMHQLINFFYAFPLFNLLSSSGNNTILSVIIVLFTSLLLVIVFSWLFYRFIEKYCEKITEKFTKLFV